MRRKTFFAFVAAAASAGVAACAASAPEAQAARAKIVERAGERFTHAVLRKPRESGVTGIEQTLVPLIVEEVAPSDATRGKNLATVYYGLQAAEIAGRKFDQVAYVWTYESATAGQAGEPYRGVRMTLDHDGYPLVWEALSSEPGPRLIFVAQALEDEARKAFGEPRAPRRFAVEKEVAPDAEAIVAAAIEQGPVPMGPYVYLSKAPERAIATILCRCSPSQVDEFIRTEAYDLQPLEALGEKRPDLVRTLREASPIEKVLRWPREAPARPQP